MSLSPGARLGPYEIVGLIGAGGMGQVYRARDTRLGRTVAIKLVQDLAADDRAGKRLVREAQHASALNHPNICTIYEIGEANGQPFISMEYVEGQPLNEVTPQDGLPIESVVGFGIQIADAVAHAHDHGIVHRDLKPSNVIVTPEGRVKVLDFGLATRTWHEGAAHAVTAAPLTQPGVIAGTIAYMPPEVLQGKLADVRSDIWSLGTMLYELTTGSLPFDGRTAFELSSQILREPPPPLPAHVSAGLSATIERCLMKDPGQRYQRASEVRAALEASRSAVAMPRLPHLPHLRRLRRPAVLAGLATITALLAYLSFFSEPALAVSSIAVVPFVNAGNNPDTEYLSDGITESVINSLAQLPESTLKVIALNSVMRYKGREIDPQAMGRDLAVEAVVVGRVVQRQDILSVSAELVNVRDKSRMWGASYNTKMADVLAMQEEIATQISDNLRLRLNPDAKKTLTKRYTDNVEAYQLYLKGRYLWNQYTEEGWTKAIDYFRQALDVDPGYALAWAGIADSYYQLSSTVRLPSEVIPRARAGAIRALEIDDSLAEAHASLGIIKAQYDWDRPGAEKEFRRAIQLNPNYATGRQWFGMYLFANGQFDEALVEFRRAQELDPFSLIIAVTAIWPLPHLGRHDEALTQLQKVIELHPTVPDLKSYFHELRGEGYLEEKMYDEAAADFLLGFKTNILTGGGQEAVGALASAYKMSGINGYWQKQLDLATVHYRQQVELANRQSQPRYVSPFRLAELYARLDQKDRAFALLEQCYEHRDESLVWLKAESSSAGSSWQSLASDPRFKDLLGRLGLGA
jgi:eukaryotic-like serine/threonine-protein kinase